jgi:hypothetical protein
MHGGRYIKESCTRVRRSSILSHGWVVHAKEIFNKELGFVTEILASSCSTCIVGCKASMSLSGIHSCVMRVRCGICP